MGQSGSTPANSIVVVVGGGSNRRENNNNNNNSVHRMMMMKNNKSSTATVILPPQEEEDEDYDEENNNNNIIIVEEDLNEDDDDYTSYLPDECLACIFQSLGSGDRKSCSLVCHRWLLVEGQNRHRISLDARSDLFLAIPSLFTRFDSVSKLALKCDRQSISISDDALVLISLRCRNLTRLKLRGCRELTELGMSALAKNCKGLKKLSCGSCTFGAKGMNAVLDHSSVLEELSVKRLRVIKDGGGGGGGAASEVVIGPGVAGSTLRTICLKELYNGQSFGPLIVGCKNLRTLKLFRCSGEWDKLLEMITNRTNCCLMEIHLERLQVSDRGLSAISNCLDLEILRLVKTPECTNVGLVSIADRCKLHIDGWKTNRIGDEGLISIAQHCPNLQELVLIGVNPTTSSLGLLASNCRNLERLALCGSETIGDAEISCIAAKCVSLKKLCIKGCPVSDHGMEALAGGCPNLVKVKVKKCRGVTCEGADWLRTSRGSLAVNLDTGSIELPEASTNNDGGAQQNGVEYPPAIRQITAAAAAADIPLNRSALGRARLGFFASRSFVAYTIRKWSNSNNNNNNSSYGNQRTT